MSLPHLKIVLQVRNMNFSPLIQNTMDFITYTDLYNVCYPLLRDFKKVLTNESGIVLSIIYLWLFSVDSWIVHFLFVIVSWFSWFGPTVASSPINPWRDDVISFRGLVIDRNRLDRWKNMGNSMVNQTSLLGTVQCFYTGIGTGNYVPGHYFLFSEPRKKPKESISSFLPAKNSIPFSVIKARHHQGLF